MDAQARSARAKTAINARLKGMTKQQRSEMTRAARESILRKIEAEAELVTQLEH